MPDLLERLRTALADRYAVESEIGRGGMATVFLAEDLKHHRKVAIKVLHPQLSVTLAAERFLNEIGLVAKLEHPHILTLIDSGETSDLLYYIMPYIMGESLRDRLEREHQLPFNEAVRIASEVADGLDFAHRHGVIHRDVKPGNILLSDRHAVITDFGIARAVTIAQGERVTTTGLGVGTPLYASPEQAAGAEMLDGRADVYSLGCVLYEMLAGVVPLSARTPQAILGRRMTETPSPLYRLRETVPPSLDQVIGKALARLPADRWETAEHFRQALAGDHVGEAGRDSIETDAAKPTMVRGPVPPPRIPGRRWISSAAIVALLVLAALGSWLATRQAAPPATEEDASVRVLSGLDKIDHVQIDRDFRGAYATAVELDGLITDDSVRSDMWAKVSRPVMLRSQPPGATVFRRDYGLPESEWELLGTTPLEIGHFPRGYWRLRFQLEGYQGREIAGGSGFLARAAPFELVPEGTLPSGMTRVTGGVQTMLAPGLQHLEPLAIGDFLVSVHEVTNQEYKAFVNGGGYRDSTCWRHAFVKDGRSLSFDEAMQEFTDRTGRPGPSSWEAGTYPVGDDDLPVSGVSWYEAEAYACHAGMDLPTVYHWYFTADTDLEWAQRIVPLSNFGGEGPAPVGTYPGVSRHGVYDMAGNVREWTRNRFGEARYILGGAWYDPEYSFVDAATAHAFDRSQGNGIRLVAYSDTTNLHLASAPIEPEFRDYASEQPVSDAVLDAYLEAYAYDRTALNDTVLHSDTTTAWIRERVEMDAAYGSERLTVYLLLPPHGDGPHQSVVYFPGSWAIQADSYEEEPGTAQYDFFPQTGRAVVFPIYKGTFERGTDLSSDVPNESNLYRDHVIAWAKDLRRTIDYLETRSDIDTDRLAYLGLSWGGMVSGIMTAVESRFKASAIWAGGLLQQRTQPMVDPFNFLPRADVPTLIINGRLDSFFPVETSVLPLYENLGTSDDRKKLIITDTGHWVLRERSLVIRETLDWFDRYLGPVE